MSNTADAANYCIPDQGSYGYRPSLAAGVIFSVLFGVSTLYALYASFRRKKWFVSFAVGGILETLGWIGRAAAYNNICSDGLFILQICCLIIAPAFYSATLYIVLGILIQKAPEHSVISPRLYIIVFCGLDFFSLLLQAIGGGIASSANTDSGAKSGADIMVAGIFVQLAGMTCFVLLGTQFLTQATRNGFTFHKRIIYPGVLCTLLIFIRNIYRAIELLGGWTGRINTTEGYLIGLDGACMVLCMLGLCFYGIVDGRDSDLLARKSHKEIYRRGSASSEGEKGQRSTTASDLSV